jgi:hypothetical protein
MLAPIAPIGAVPLVDPNRRDLETVPVRCVRAAGPADSRRSRLVGEDEQGIGRLHAPTAGQDQ